MNSSYKFVYQRFLTAFFLLCISAIATVAQVAGGLNETTNTNLGGTNFIVGTVFWPTGRPVNTRLRIKLLSTHIGEILATTDDRGQFVFSRLPAGTYSIEIDREEEFESVSQFVEIERSKSSIPETYTVSIRLRERRKPPSKPTVVSVETAGASREAVAHYNDAVKASSAGDPKKAIDSLRLAVNAYPRFVDAYNEMAVQYMRLNELEKALAALKEALRINPEAFEPTLNQGIALFRLTRYAEAETALRAAIKAQEHKALPRHYLGRSLIELENYSEAETELGVSIKLGGKEMKESHRALANLYITKGDNRSAVRELETYLNLAPDAPDRTKLLEILDQLKSQIN